MCVGALVCDGAGWWCIIDYLKQFSSLHEPYKYLKGVQWSSAHYITTRVKCQTCKLHWTRWCKCTKITIPKTSEYYLKVITKPAIPIINHYKCDLTKHTWKTQCKCTFPGNATTNPQTTLVCDKLTNSKYLCIYSRQILRELQLWDVPVHIKRQLQNANYHNYSTLHLSTIATAWDYTLKSNKNICKYALTTPFLVHISVRNVHKKWAWLLYIFIQIYNKQEGTGKLSTILQFKTINSSYQTWSIAKLHKCLQRHCAWTTYMYFNYSIFILRVWL